MARIRDTKNTDDKLKTSIVLLKALNPSWTATKVRNHLLNLQRKDNKSDFAKLKIPEARAVQKTIKDYKPLLQIALELDVPWSLGTLNQYPIDADMIKNLLMLKAEMKENGRNLSIRQARWICRLIRIPDSQDEKKITTEEEFKAYWDRLMWLSICYSMYEKLCEVRKVPCDTAIFDAPTLDEIEKKTGRYKENPLDFIEDMQFKDGAK